MKITTKDGKLLYAIRAGRLVTINSDHAVIAKFEGVLLRNKDKNSKSDCPQVEVQTSAEEEREKTDIVVAPNLNEQEEEGDETSATGQDLEVESNIPNTGEVMPLEIESLDSSDNSQVQHSQSAEERNQVHLKDLRRFDVIKFRRAGENVFSKGELTERAGKKGGINEFWWNIKDDATGHIQAENAKTFSEVEKIQEENREDEEAAFAVNIPRWRHAEKRCTEAKKSELEMFDKYDVYEEVSDVGQERLGTMWLLTEKIKCGKNIVKARLNIRGDQEDTSDMRKDSPTVRKGNIKIVLMIAASREWEIKTSDVSNAFLQSVPIEREVYVQPPKERRVPGTLWKLKKTAYGLADASRGFFLSFSGRIQELGCEKSLLDPAMFMFFTSKPEKDDIGLAVTHVDDIVHAGDKNFDTTVIKPLKESFKFGSEENLEFRYVGLNIKQSKDIIVIDQNHYVESLELPDMEVCENIGTHELMDKEGQTEFRSAVGKVAHVGHHSRPDVCFEAKALSSKFGKATKQDLKVAMKKIQKLKSQKTKIVYPNLGNISDWLLLGHGDAGIKSMPDKLTSVGGQVILVVNRTTNHTCVLGWTPSS